MKAESVLPLLPLLPLPVGLVFTATGITFDIWVYVLLAIPCPAAAGLIWFIYREMEKKVEAALPSR